jgi:hypothetical protein
MVLTAWLMINLKKLQDKLPDTLKNLFSTEGTVGAASSAVGAARPQSS